MKEKCAEFEMKLGMIQAFGCIDESHIPIKCPHEKSQEYFNYKQFHSLNVQAVCDYKGCFMDIECYWLGSVHDARVFANSSMCKQMKGNEIPQTYFDLLPGYESIPNYLIGDPAYRLTPNIMKEYLHCKK